MGTRAPDHDNTRIVPHRPDKANLTRPVQIGLDENIARCWHRRPQRPLGLINSGCDTSRSFTVTDRDFSPD